MENLFKGNCFSQRKPVEANISNSHLLLFDNSGRLIVFGRKL